MSDKTYQRVHWLFSTLYALTGLFTFFAFGMFATQAPKVDVHWAITAGASFVACLLAGSGAAATSEA